jgi:hypothetical protein
MTIRGMYARSSEKGKHSNGPKMWKCESHAPVAFQSQDVYGSEPEEGRQACVQRIISILGQIVATRRFAPNATADL